MSYEYEPLPLIEESEDLYIRLLRLHPGPRSGLITCNIIVTRLSEAPVFEALSYCWGKEHIDHYIYVVPEEGSQDASSSGAALKVPGSVVPFLYRDRNNRSKSIRTLWIDSICINQKDMVEKSVQVAKMREIYMKAETTISWLGPGEDCSTEGIEYAHRLSKLYRKYCAKSGLLEMSAEETKENINTKIKIGDPGLEGLIKILDRPYFERAWIVQEVVVSDCVVLFCGDAMIYWDVLQAAFAYLIEVTPWIWDFYPAHRTDHLSMLRFSESDWKAGRDVAWWRVLLRHRLHNATNPRDKVYAYYGLRCQQGLQELQIVPDYENTTTETLFVQLAVSALLLGHTEVFHVPRLVTSAEEKIDPYFLVTKLPSWAPDWRWTSRTPGSLLHDEWYWEELPKKFTFHATSNSAFTVGFDVPLAQPIDRKSMSLPSCIRLFGVTIARVSNLTPVYVYEEPPGRRTLFGHSRVFKDKQQQAIDFQNALQPSASSQLHSPTKESFENALFDTLMAGGTTYSLEEKRSAMASFKQRQRILGLVPATHFLGTLVVFSSVILIRLILHIFGFHKSDSQFRRMTRPMTNRKTARLASDVSADIDYLGLVPALCELGDHVVLVQGVRTPLVLRRKGEASISKENAQGQFDIIQVQAWEFIGDCYVHGVMNGEVWETRREECEELWIA